MKVLAAGIQGFKHPLAKQIIPSLSRAGCADLRRCMVKAFVVFRMTIFYRGSLVAGGGGAALT
jgi:hypothetical protein